jgi:hypothetical protein
MGGMRRGMTDVGTCKPLNPAATQKRGDVGSQPEECIACLAFDRRFRMNAAA